MGGIDEEDLGMAISLHWVGRRFEGLGKAFAEVWFYVLFGCGTGLGLAAWSSALDEGFWKPLLEHLGMGLIVSAIAIVLYEWRSEIPKILGLAKNLAAVSRAEGREGLDRILETLIGNEKSLPEGARDVRENCQTVILTLSELLSHQSRISDQYAGFISSLLRVVVNKNLKAFSDLTTGSTALFHVPASAAVLADDALSAQMTALDTGDSYDVVSDLRTWQEGQLAGFQAATEAAANRGVRIRRLFNLAHNNNRGLSADTVQKILENHVESMAKTARLDGSDPPYQVRVLTKKNVKDLHVADTHFGIFCLKDGPALNFQFVLGNLSEIVISPATRGANSKHDEFERLWSEAPKLTPAYLEEMVSRQMRRRVRRGTPTRRAALASSTSAN
ncbi:MAG TPA: hypothetical protein VGS22_03665 [Thermoanaerobaculia bacterium]|nr:hypothetical protein [Thermoanaerobaculia bacterium]